VFNIIKSLLTTSAIAAAIALILLPLTKSFLTIFFVSIIIQFIVFYIIGSIIDVMSEIKLKQIEAITISELSKQSIEVECPCFKKAREVVPVTLNQDNSYKCGTCGKTNSIIITAETASVTEPISLTLPIPAPEQ